MSKKISFVKGRKKDKPFKTNISSKDALNLAVGATALAVGVTVLKDL